MQALQATDPTAAEVIKDNTDFIVLKFADAKIPVFKETKNRDYILYGEDNNYPEYLTYLFNKSAKHNAIITGKSFYVFGSGFLNGDFIINRLNESLNDITKKATLDVILYGGFRFEVIYNAAGQVAEVYHTDYNTIRLGKAGGYFFSEEWQKYSSNSKDYSYIPEFDPNNPDEPQVFSYNEYRPGTKYYPLPDYIGANNYIETDIEISKYYLSAIRNGMMPSKLIEFFSGEPTEDKKKEIERRFTNKFTGSENSGRIILAFNKDKGSPINITDLSATDLDKQFIELNNTCQQEIFSGHLVTSPMLFGIKTEGQLGGNTELKTAYDLFNNTYAKPVASAISKEITYLLSYSVFKGVYALEPTEPVGNQVDIKDVINSLPREYVFQKLQIPEELWDSEPLTDAGMPATPQGIETPLVTSDPINEHVKNLSGRQQQQVERIIRKYKKKQLEEPAARTLLSAGLGLSDDQINSLLGIVTGTQLASQELNLDDIIQMFDECGDVKADYEILKSKRVHFEVADMADDEKIFMEEAFRSFDVTATEAKIIELIKKDPRIDTEHIASVIHQTKALVENKIKSLVSRGYVEEVEEAIGGGQLLDRVIRRTIPEDITMPKTKIDSKPITSISIKYSYEGPQDSRNRPFCAKLMQLDRLYTRVEIEKISARAGYSVWDRRGGFWRHQDGTTTPYCRHIWKSNIVVKKQS